MRRRGPRRPRRGQVLVFGAIVLMAVVLTIIFAVNLGRVAARRVQLQNAADAAAYAGALVEADAMSTIAWLNDGMAYIYYHLMRYNVDVAVYAVHRRLKETGPPYPEDGVVGINDAPGRHEEALARADVWIPRGEEWLERLGRIERAVALSAEILLEKEVYGAAASGGAYRTALFPDPVFYPDPESNFALNIRQVSPNHWVFWTDDYGFQLEAFERGEDDWTIIYGDLEINIDRLDEDTWHITATDDTDLIIRRLPGGGTVQTPGGPGIQVTQDGDVTTVVSSGHVTRIRRVADGFEQSVDGGDWEPVGGTASLTLPDGSRVRVDVSQSISFPGGYSVHIDDPPSVTIGRTHITLSDPLRITTRVGPLSLRLEDDEVITNGLSTRQTRGVWHRYGDDRTRHRLLVMGDDLWRYEYHRAQSLLAEGSLANFAFVHAIGDNEEGAAPDDYPAWCAWYDAPGGRPSGGGRDYHQTRVCWQCDGEGTVDDRPCPLCRGRDHDDDDRSDIRVYLSDTWGYRGGRGLDALDRQSVARPNVARPLELTEEFFRQGINVGVWNPADEPLLWFVNPEWGYFLLASARAGVWENDFQAYRYRFLSEDEREEWLAESYINLYEPDWEAKLCSTRDAFYSWDIRADGSTDTGAGYLLRGLIHTEWRPEYFGHVDPTVDNHILMMGVDWRSGELEEALDH